MLMWLRIFEDPWQKCLRHLQHYLGLDVAKGGALLKLHCVAQNRPVGEVKAELRRNACRPRQLRAVGDSVSTHLVCEAGSGMRSRSAGVDAPRRRMLTLAHRACAQRSLGSTPRSGRATWSPRGINTKTPEHVFPKHSRHDLINQSQATQHLIIFCHVL